MSVALGCKRFKECHTFDAIAEQIVNIYSNFGLDYHNITFTVTDNGSNFVKAFNEFQDDTDCDGSENPVSLELAEPQNSSNEEDTYGVETIDVDTILTNEEKQSYGKLLCSSSFVRMLSTSIDSILANEKITCLPQITFKS